MLNEVMASANDLVVDHDVAVVQADQAARTFPYTVRTDDTPKVRFSAAVGEQPEIELALA